MVDEGCHPFLSSSYSLVVHETIYKNNFAFSSSLVMNEGPLLDEAALYQEALRDQIRTHHEDLLKLQGTVPMPIRVASAQHCSLPHLH